MVTDSGQLYTIEGIAAAILMVTTVYLVLSTTSIFTPGDSHISDLQLEQLGNDALAMMDTPDHYLGQSELETEITRNQTDKFNATFTSYLNSTSTKNEKIYYNATIFFTNSSTGLQNAKFSSYDKFRTGREKMVRVTRFVRFDPPGTPLPGMDSRSQDVLLEVLLWRD